MKIWIYQSDRKFSAEEKASISAELEQFVESWNAHGKMLDASYEMPYDHFIILKVDEEIAQASGCSIDDSVRFIKSLEQKYNLSLFDRQKVAYLKGEEVEITNLHSLSSLYKEGQLGEDTLVFNNLVNGNEFEKLWKSPLRNTPYMNFV